MPFTATQTALVSGFCSFLSFGVYAAFLLAVLVAVRPKRPDATTMLVVSATIFLISFVVRWFLSTFMPMVAERSGVGISGIYVYSAISIVVGTILNVIGMVCLIVGVVKLASPPNDPRPLHLPPGA